MVRWSIHVYTTKHSFNSYVVAYRCVTLVRWNININNWVCLLFINNSSSCGNVQNQWRTLMICATCNFCTATHMTWLGLLITHTNFWGESSKGLLNSRKVPNFNHTALPFTVWIVRGGQCICWRDNLIDWQGHLMCMDVLVVQLTLGWPNVCELNLDEKNVSDRLQSILLGHCFQTMLLRTHVSEVFVRYFIVSLDIDKCYAVQACMQETGLEWLILDGPKTAMLQIIWRRDDAFRKENIFCSSRGRPGSNTVPLWMCVQWRMLLP